METKPSVHQGSFPGPGNGQQPQEGHFSPPNLHRLHISKSSPGKIQKDASNQSSTNGSDEGFLIFKMCNSTLSYIWNIT